MVKALLICRDRDFLPWSGCKWLGRMLTPGYKGHNRIYHHYTAIDNCAFSNWDQKQFYRLLLSHSPVSDLIQWVACPDVVGDWSGTRARFAEHAGLIQRLGYRLAYVAQDGQPESEVPWTDVACLFLGGSTDYKLGDEALTLCHAAKTRGKLVHVGRINSTSRAERFVGVMDSMDGMSWSRYRSRDIPKLIRWLEAHYGA